MKKYLAFLYPLLLFLYPFWNVNEGVDFMDVGYNLGNVTFWEQLGTTWKLSTYLSNILGRIFYHLPMGDTLLGMNIYGSLLISALALCGYFFAKKYVPSKSAFLGNFIAISLCWCPTAKLYDYLTYVLLTIGVLFLYEGITKEKKRYLIFAGFFLGMNVFTRLPNLAEVLMIVLLWYACFLSKKKWKEGMKLTGYCILGYVIGLLLPFLLICMSFGIGAFITMISGVGEIEANASDYSFVQLLTGAFTDYIRSFKWVAVYGVYLLGGLILFRIWPGKWKQILPKLMYLLGMLVLYRFFWGQAMFDLNYYSYGVMFWPTVLFLVWSLGICIYRFVQVHGKKKCQMSQEEAVQTMLVFLLIIITPFGSNNKSYSIMNNLFLVAPFILYWSFAWLRGTPFVVKSLIGVATLFFLVQITLFGLVFTFGDGTYQEKRDAKIENNGILRGMYTSEAKANTIEDLTIYLEQIEDTSMITYGNIPALSYYLNKKPAFGSSWPDLESYALRDYKKDIERVAARIKEERPVILINKELDEEDKQREKYILLENLMKQYDYQRKVETDFVMLYH